MNCVIATLGCLAAWAGHAWADMEPVAVNPEPPPAAMEELTVDLTCVLPTNGPAVECGVLVARLYEFNPRQADYPATEICQITLAGVSHRPGEETVLRFPCRGQTVARKAYYLTAVVYPQGDGGQAGLYFLNGFRRVLVAGSREALVVTLTPVAGEAGPTN